ncbi:MAG: FHA domain-containing protein [Proteobacteria bacterium]|nr:FHA domain-containing protein [Pseudomonadota bacterium]
MPKVIYFSTSGKWQEYPLGPHTTIGRHPDQNLQLLDRMISKEHAIISLAPDGHYVLTDIGSKNGTFVNEEPVYGSRVLRDGDDIGLGNHILKFVDPPQPPPQPEPTEEDIATTKELSPADLSSQFQTLSVQAIRQPISDAHFLPESQITSEQVLRQDYEKLRVAAELSATAATTVDFDQLLNVIIDKAFHLFKADRVAILLRDESGQMCTRVALDRDRKPIQHFKISETLLEEVIIEKSAVLSGDALSDQRFSASNSLIVANVRSTMCVPLIYEDEVLGVINLDTQLMTGAFVEKDLQILTGFARQAAFTLQQGRMIEETRKNAIIRDNLRRIISPHLVDDVMSGKIQLQKNGQRTESTVLFADIRGFTQLTEQHEPELIVNMLNEIFEKMVECIFNHDGVLDKFIGDEVMAVWGVRVGQENHALSAVHCAIEMMNAIHQMNTIRKARFQPPIYIGIGIATGVVIAGYMGSTQAMSYTVIGDTVNLGARLCSAAQPSEILINEEAWKRVNDTVESVMLPPIMVKGKRDQVSVYRVYWQE